MNGSGFSVWSIGLVDHGRDGYSLHLEACLCHRDGAYLSPTPIIGPHVIHVISSVEYEVIGAHVPDESDPAVVYGPPTRKPRSRGGKGNVIENLFFCLRAYLLESIAYDQERRQSIQHKGEWCQSLQTTFAPQLFETI